MRKFVLLIIATGLFMCQLSAAQEQKSVEHKQTYEFFDAVEVSSNYEVYLHNSNKYETLITVGESISSYVTAYVKGGTLYVSMDEKALPSELKRAFKTKGYVYPELKVDIYMPECKRLTLSEKSSVTGFDSTLNTDKFYVVLNGFSSIENLSVKTGNLELELNHHSSAKIQAAANKAKIKCTSISSLEMTLEVDKLSVDMSGSSTANLKCTCSDDAEFGTSGTGKVTVSGTAKSLTVKGNGMSQVDALGLSVTSADIDIAGSCGCHVNAKDKLKMDLSGSSHLYYAGDPKLDIVRIITSSLTHEN